MLEEHTSWIRKWILPLFLNRYVPNTYVIGKEKTMFRELRIKENYESKPKIYNIDLGPWFLNKKFDFDVELCSV